jgi:DNA-binding ferritin-like protein (Dps family)
MIEEENENEANILPEEYELTEKEIQDYLEDRADNYWKDKI